MGTMELESQSCELEERFISLSWPMASHPLSSQSQFHILLALPLIM